MILFLQKFWMWITGGTALTGAGIWLVIRMGLWDLVKELILNWFKGRAKDKKEPPEPASMAELNSFKSVVMPRLDELGRIVESGVHEIKDAAREQRDAQRANSLEIRETLMAFKMGIDTSLGDVHEKANTARLEVATLKGRVEAIERKMA